MVIIGATAHWYFGVSEEEDSNTTMSAKAFFSNHLGTAAAGSIIITVLSPLKLVFAIIAVTF